jgi:hypothetical protein
VDELRRLALDGFNHPRMAMACSNDSDSGREIQEAIAVDVLDNGAFTVVGDKRIRPSVGRRYYAGVAFDYGARSRAWQLREDAWKFHSCYFQAISYC